MPVAFLLGPPTGSQMFRMLILALADRFHPIASGYVGVGSSEAQLSEEIDHAFDNLVAHVSGLLDHLVLASCVLYMQDYCGPLCKPY